MSDRVSIVDNLGRIALIDAIALKHELNTSIRYGTQSLNAHQITKALRLDDDDWSALHRDAINHVQLYAASPSWTRTFLFALPVLGCWAFASARVAWAMSVCWFVWWVWRFARWNYTLEGYKCGYEGGIEHATLKALGIAPEQLSEIHERSVEIQMDAQVLDNAKRRKQLDVEADT